ncbi:MAG: hypothetical protein HYS21_01435 [Deltaproteobacteria bacterium]|nr:hypothetical protein [Deltaproteobacteria bacterium]
MIKEFENTLYNAIIYGFGMALSKYDAFSQEMLLRDVGRNIIDYLKDYGIEFKSGSTAEETVANVISTFVEKGFVDRIEVTNTDKGVYGKWCNLVGIEAYKKLFDETGSPFISCPLTMVIMACIEPFGYTVKLNDVSFDMASRTAESLEELTLMPIPKQGEANPLVYENIRLYEKAKEKAILLEKEISEHKKTSEMLQEKLDDVQSLNKMMIGREIKMEELRKEIQRLKAIVGEK